MSRLSRVKKATKEAPTQLRMEAEIISSLMGRVTCSGTYRTLSTRRDSLLVFSELYTRCVCLWPAP